MHARSRVVAGLTTGLCAVLTGGFMLPAQSVANGPCGQDFDGSHACGVDSPASESGSLTTDNERDYYVFYAQEGTELHVSITDTEAPGCSTSSSIVCGDAYAEVDDSQGNRLDSTDFSQPHNGITVSQNFDTTINSTGTYYLVVVDNWATTLTAIRLRFRTR